MYLTANQLRSFFDSKGYKIGAKATYSLMSKASNVIKEPHMQISEEDAKDLIELYLEIPHNYILSKDAENLYKLSEQKIRGYIDEELVSSCVRLHEGGWRLFVNPEDLHLLENCVTQTELENELKSNGIILGHEKVRELLNSHPSVIKRENNKKNLLHKDYVEDIVNEYKIPEGFISINEAAKITGMSRDIINTILKSNSVEIYRARYGHAKTLIKLSDLEKHFEEEGRKEFIARSTKTSPIKDDNFYSVREAAEHFGVSTTAIHSMIKKNEFTKVKTYKVDGHTVGVFIEKDEVHILKAEREKLLTQERPSFNKVQLINQFKREIVESEHIIKENKELFADFVTHVLNRMGDRETSLYNRKWELMNAFQKVIVSLPEAIYEFDKESLVEVLNNKEIPTYLKQDFVRFYNHSCKIKGVKKHKLSMGRNNRKTPMSEPKDDEVYPPAIYNLYYNYAKEVEMHIPNALTKRSYANMWLFSSFLLVDMWRATDLFYEVPHINIDLLDIYDFSWFETNRLNEEQVLLVIEQLRLSMNYASVGKTGADLLFLMIPELEEPIATAAVICELHSRLVPDYELEQKKYLLGTFFEGATPQKLKTSSSGRPTHHTFFKLDNVLKNVKFSSHKLCKSTMTYVYFHVVENGGDGDIDTKKHADKNLSKGRSHGKANSVIPYVAHMNKDVSLDNVAINLFRRGHFGWLYNTMVNQVANGLGIDQTMKNRTSAIQELREEFPLQEVEDWAEGLLQSKKNKEVMVRRLMKMERHELIEEVVKIYKCQKSSRDGCGQCFSYPDCKEPHKTRCLGCSEFIPQYQILREAKSEFFRIVQDIQNHQLETLKVRDSMFLYRLYSVIGEAVKAFGKEKVNAYIPLSDVSTQWKNVKQLLQLPEKV